jgi:hypothetical protein
MKGERKTPLREDPKRLRDCLNALSEACGHDVFRFETIVTKTGHTFTITCSREVAEKDIALIIAAELRKHYEKVELDAGELEANE